MAAPRYPLRNSRTRFEGKPRHAKKNGAGMGFDKKDREGMGQEIEKGVGMKKEKILEDESEMSTGANSNQATEKPEDSGDKQVKAAVKRSNRRRRRPKRPCPYGCPVELMEFHSHFLAYHLGVRVYGCDVCHFDLGFPGATTRPSHINVPGAYPVPLSNYVVARKNSSKNQHSDLLPLEVITTDEATISMTTAHSTAGPGCFKRVAPGSLLPKAKRQCVPNSYQEGDSVKLEDGSYFRITQLCRDIGRQQIYRGHRLLLQKALKEQILPPSEGELVWVTEQSPHDETAHEIFTASVQPAKVVNKCQIVFTNDLQGKRQSQGSDQSIMYCRWKVVIHACVNGVANFNQPCGIMSIERITEAEADHNARVEDAKLRRDWRGIHREPPSHRNHGTNHYTMGDAFCGVGGFSRGALDANLEVKWGFDNDKDAIEAYWQNFGRSGTVCKKLDVQQFIQICKEEEIVDILHASPPCQAFSREFAGEKHQQMKGLLQTVANLVQVTKPRLFCLEEVPKLTRPGNIHHFRALVRTLISLGFSVRWRTICCWRYGVPQLRERLFLFAAAPGEKLPRFPKPTHGLGSEMKPYRTIGNALAKINRQETTHHDLAHSPRPGTYRENVLSPTVLCKRIGDGTKSIAHPHGHRKYTIREVARLQDFPDKHVFSKPWVSAHRQIGNAVPPSVAKAMMTVLKESLEETDAVVRGRCNQLLSRMDRSPG